MEFPRCARPGWARSHPNSSKTAYSCGFAGALLLFDGLLIIAFHQYWSSVAAIMISLFGWILALRGLVLMAAPNLYERAAMSRTKHNTESNDQRLHHNPTNSCGF